MDTLVLRAVAQELDRLIRGRRVRRAGLRSERELALVLSGEPAPEMLVLAVEPGVPHLRLEPAGSLSRRLTDQLGDAAPLLAGALVTGAEAVGFERVLHLALEAHPGWQGGPPGPPVIDLYFELLPRTPFLVVTGDDKIVAAVRAPGTSRPDDRRMERGSPYVLPFGLGSPGTQSPAAEVIAATLAGLEDRERWAAAMASLHRGVTRETLSHLLAGARDVAEATARLAAYRGPVLIEHDRDGAPVLAAGVPGDSRLRGEGGTEERPLPPALAVMAAWAHRRAARERAFELRTRLARALSTEREKTRRASRKLARDRAKAGDAASQRQRGEAILAHLSEVPRGASTVVLRNPYAEDEELTIALDPRRSPAANAESYFRSARRAERAAQHLAKRERALAERDGELAGAMDRLDRTADDALPALARDLAGADLVAGDLVAGPRAVDDERAGERRAPKGGEKASRLPYRSYDLGGGWEVWVGRSNADNDVLTHRLARPHDHWFHVHGASGSHVILRRSDGSKGQPPASVVQAAAACAAFFSRARHSRLVPVIVTEKRYVRKPRGSPPGTAACLREKTMMVEPARPGLSSEEEGRK